MASGLLNDKLGNGGQSPDSLKLRSSLAVGCTAHFLFIGFGEVPTQKKNV